MPTVEKPARYISRFLNLRIVVRGTYTQAVEGRVVTTPGKSIQFEGGVFETTDKDEQAFIEARPEFGQIIIKAPENIENLAGAREEMMKDLETREKELKAREEALAAKEKELGVEETGKSDGETVLEDMTKEQLLAVAEAEGVEGVDKKTKNEEIVAAIKAKREETAAFTD